MDLSPELFAEVVAATAATVAAAASTDRRSPRARTDAALAVCPWADPQSVVSLAVRDFSAGGCGLFSRRRMALDEQVVVRLPRAGSDSAPVLGRVIYWEPLAPGRYAIGVHFDRVVTEAELAGQIDDHDDHGETGVIGRITHAFSWTWRKAS